MRVLLTVSLEDSKPSSELIFKHTYGATVKTIQLEVETSTQWTSHGSLHFPSLRFLSWYRRATSHLSCPCSCCPISNRDLSKAWWRHCASGCLKGGSISDSVFSLTLVILTQDQVQCQILYIVSLCLQGCSPADAVPTLSTCLHMAHQGFGEHTCC